MSSFNLKLTQVGQYVADRFEKEPDIALDTYATPDKTKWAVVPSDSGAPQGYEYAGTYTYDKGIIRFAQHAKESIRLLL